jgi:RNA polymerase sigma factor (sigma-70 family)
MMGRTGPSSDTGEIPVQTYQTTHLLRQVRCWLAVQALDVLADADLLERFRQEHSEAAFAVLMQRHGPLVLRVCGQVLDDRHAVEDAFQATFLVLARQARTIRKSTSLAAWLHGVACRIACRMRTRARRTIPAASLSSMADADPAAELTRRELGRALHEEIDRLPEPYRQVTVLCCVEGTSRDEAARRLGVPATAVKKRLEGARGLLRQRLTRRGIVPSATVLAGLLEQTVGPPAVRATLLESTLQAAVSFQGGSTAAGVGSAGAVAAARQAVWTMSLARGKSLLLVLTLALLGSAASGLALTGRTGPPAADRPAQPAAAPAEPAADLRDDTPLPAGAVARLGTAHWQQDGEVFFVAFDRQDKQLITARQPGAHRCTVCHQHPFEHNPASRGGGESMIAVWDLRSAKLQRQFGKLPAHAPRATLIGEDGAVRLARKDQAHALPSISVAASPAGDLLAQAGRAGPVVLWDLVTGKQKELGRADPQAGLVSLAFSPDGKLLASLGAGGRVRLYDVATGKEAPGGVATDADRQVGWGDTVVFAPSGRLLAVTGEIGVVEVWELGTGKRTLQLKGRARGSPAVSFSPDGRRLAWAAADGTVRLTDVATGKAVGTLGGPEQTRYLAGLAFAPDGRRLATRGYDGSVRLWDVAGGRQERQLRSARTTWHLGRHIALTGSAAPAGGLAFTHDGKLLAVAGPGGAVSFWSVADGREVFPGHKAPVAGVVFPADGKSLYSLGEDGTVRQWDLAGGRHRQSIALPAEARSAVLAPDSRAVVYRTDQKTLVVWDLATGAARARVPDLEIGLAGVCPGCQPEGGRCLSSDGKLLARLGVDGTVGVWEVPSGRRRWTFADGRTGILPAIRQALQDLAFAADGRHLVAVVGRPQPPAASVLLWDVGRGKLMRRLDGLPLPSASAVLAPDGRTLATADQEGTVVLWEIATSKERVHLRTAKAGPLTALAYSPDSTQLVGAGPEQILYCWDALTGERLGQRHGTQSHVGVLAFAPGGRQLVSGGGDGTLLLWDVASLQQAERPRAARLDPDAQRQCWDDLASPDAGRATRALAQLRAASQEAVALVRRLLRPAAAPDGRKVEGWIKDLDSEAFPRRAQASAELAKLGDLAEPALRKALENQSSLEVKRRIEQLLNKLQKEEPSSWEELRALRAVELLERLAEPDADRLLQDLSAGAAGARLTREAQAARERRRQRPGR